MASMEMISMLMEKLAHHKEGGEPRDEECGGYS